MTHPNEDSMSATSVDLQTILRAAFDRLAIDPSQPDQWSIAGETACLRAMQHAYDLGLDDGKILARIQDKAAAHDAKATATGSTHER